MGAAPGGSHWRRGRRRGEQRSWRKAGAGAAWACATEFEAVEGGQGAAREVKIGQGHRTPRTPTTPVADPSRTSPNPVGWSFSEDNGDVARFRAWFDGHHPSRKRYFGKIRHAWFVEFVWICMNLYEFVILGQALCLLRRNFAAHAVKLHPRKWKCQQPSTRCCYSMLLSWATAQAHGWALSCSSSMTWQLDCSSMLQPHCVFLTESD